MVATAYALRDGDRGSEPCLRDSWRAMLGRVRPATPAEFLEQPNGRFVSGRGWLYFGPTPDVAGCVLWGHVEDAAVREMVKIAPASHRPTAAPHGALLDASRVERADPSAFGIMQRYFATHRASLVAVVKRLAIVRPDGFIGTVASGFFRVVHPPYPVEIFERAEDALRWLDVDDGGALLSELDLHQQAADEVTPIQHALHAALQSDLRAGVERAAEMLHLSVRTLQRRLHEARTSFPVELGIARVRAAQRILSERDTPITVVALEVGFASPSHFTSQFRKVTGETPSEWRARQRPPPTS